LLTPHEKREWAYYRTSATDPHHVWNAARALWRQHGLEDKDAAALMGLKPSTVADSRTKRFVLRFNAAQRLTTALNHPGGPEALLPLQSRDSAK
jgi:hypothetical protein